MYLSFAQRYDFRVPAIISQVELCYRRTERNEETANINAVWDTGATKTFISQRLADKLCIIPLEFEPVLSATGRQMAGLIDISVKLPNGLRIPDKRAFICGLPGSIDMIIGMDIRLVQ
ncbi:MAG: retroviral-like aspartic protease family protein [Spirochaetales bacterium]|jgi:hypothetical protein|nr:retroviral-like aspartic protease family protein [Spirochaetales bacterium]